MTPHVVIAIYLGGIVTGLLAAVVYCEVRDARRVIRQAPVTRLPSNVRKIETAPRVIGRRSS